MRETKNREKERKHEFGSYNEVCCLIMAMLFDRGLSAEKVISEGLWSSVLHNYIPGQRWKSKPAIMDSGSVSSCDLLTVSSVNLPAKSYLWFVVNCPGLVLRHVSNSSVW